MGHRKQLLRGIAELRTLAGLPAVAVPLSPREVEGEVLQVGPDGTLHRRIARKQEQDQELYVKVGLTRLASCLC